MDFFSISEIHVFLAKSKVTKDGREKRNVNEMFGE